MTYRAVPWRTVANLGEPDLRACAVPGPGSTRDCASRQGARTAASQGGRCPPKVSATRPAPPQKPAPAPPPRPPPRAAMKCRPRASFGTCARTGAGSTWTCSRTRRSSKRRERAGPSRPCRRRRRRRPNVGLARRLAGSAFAIDGKCKCKRFGTWGCAWISRSDERDVTGWHPLGPIAPVISVGALIASNVKVVSIRADLSMCTEVRPCSLS